MEKVIIDVEGRFTDGISGKAGAAINAVERLAKTKIFVKFDAKTSPFLKALDKAKKYADKFGKTRVSATLEATDKATRVIGQVWNFGRKIGGTVWRGTVSVVDKATAPIRGIINLLKNPVLQAGAALGLSFGAANMISAYKDFESMMDKVGAISGATTRDMDMLTAKAKEMGASTKFTATEAGEALSYMAMAGWSPGQMMKGIGGIMNLAAASGESLGTTSDIVTDALTAFKMAPDESTYFADVLAAASSKSNTNVALMGETFKYAAAQAGTLGYDIKDTALSVGLMANAGIKGSMAGTALASIWTRLATNTGGAADAIKALGVEFYDQYGNARKWRNVLDELRAATAGMTDAQKASLAYTVAGMEGQKGLLPLLEASADDYKKLAAAVDNADGASTRMARRMMDNLEGSIKLLQSAAEGAKLAIMDVVGPYLKSGVDWLTDKVPAAGEIVSRAFGKASDKIQGISRKIREITHDPAFESAGFGEKISMLFKGAVTDPLGGWWESGGREKAIETAGKVGNALGGMLRTGLLAAFGVTDLLNDNGMGENAGMSLAQSFAKGFADGLDFSLVADKFQDALGNIWEALPGWGKALAGGIIGSKIIGGISSAVLGGINLYNGAKQGVGLLSQAGLLLTGRSAIKAAAMAGGGAAAKGAAASGSMAAATGAMASGTATIGSAAIGAGAVFGGLATGASVLHIGKSLYDAVRAYGKGDRTSGRAELVQAGAATAGLGVGAIAGVKLGASIGTAFGPVGTLIGAGIGGLGGWFAGDKIAAHIRSARYESEEMKEAIQDTNMSAEELAQTFDSVVYRNLKNDFGDMELSAKEISRLAEQITWGENLENANRFLQAAQDTENSLAAIQKAAGSTDRWMWKAGLGVTFDENEKADIQNAFEDYAVSAQGYLENKHFEFTAAAELFMDIKEGEGKSFVDSSSAYFTGLEKQVEGLSGQLDTQLGISLKDGKISLDEQSVISGLQKQIEDIVEKVGNAERQGEMQLLNLKYGGRKLGLESFMDLNSELQNSNAGALETFKSAYKADYAGKSLEYNDENTTAERRTEIEKELGYLNKSYRQKVFELRQGSETFLKNTLSNTYGKGIANALWGGLQDSLKSGVSPMEWGTNDVASLLGTKNLSNETAGKYKEYLKMAFDTLNPLELGEQEVDATLKANFNAEAGNDPFTEVQKILDANGLTANAEVDINATWKAENIGSPEGAIMALVSQDKQFAVPFTALAQVGWTLDENTSKPNIAELVSPDGTQRVPVDAELVPQWTAAGGGIFDPSMLTKGVGPVSVPVNVEYSANKFAGSQTADFGVAQSYPANTEVDIAAEFDPEKFDYSQDKFGVDSNYDASTTVNVRVHYNAVYDAMPNFSANVPKTVQGGVSTLTQRRARGNARGGLIGADGPAGFADGGMVHGGPQLVTVAEEGTPEMIIPLGSHRRQRGLELWRRAGDMLGVRGFARGGLTGRYRQAPEPIAPPKMCDAPVRQDGETKITVNVGGITLQIDASGADGDIVSGVEQNKDKIADIIMEVVRKAVSEIFTNSPALGGETA